MTSETRSLISDADLSRGRGRLIYRITLGVMATVFVLIFLFPLYWMFSGAVKSPAELAQPVPTLLPQEWHWDTFLEAWNILQIGKFLWNTTLYAVGGWLISLLFDVAAAYSLSKLRPIFGRVVLGGMLASLMLPAAALLVPAYLTVVEVPIFGWNLLNTPWALWLPGIANAFNIYVLKRFFDQIPDELLDSASMDGAGKMRLLWHIILPLSRPVLAVVSIFAIIGAWKDFLWPLLVLQEPQTQTISVALSRLSATGYVTPNELFAGLALASIPMIVVFMIFQRSILSGLSAGALKG